VRAKVGGMAPGTGVEVSSPCSGGIVTTTTCDAYDTAEAAVSDLP
jgi:hypothetical protein